MLCSFYIIVVYIVCHSLYEEILLFIVSSSSRIIIRRWVSMMVIYFSLVLKYDISNIGNWIRINSISLYGHIFFFRRIFFRFSLDYHFSGTRCGLRKSLAKLCCRHIRILKEKCFVCSQNVKVYIYYIHSYSYLLSQLLYHPDKCAKKKAKKKPYSRMKTV